MAGMKRFNINRTYIQFFGFQNVYTLEQLQYLYNIHENDLLIYYIIISNMTKEWKNKLKDENCNNLP